MSNKERYEVKKFSKNRKMVFDLLDLSTKKHHVKALMELDVTEGRNFIREHEEKTGEKLSFSGWIIKCIGNTVTEFPAMNAIRKGKRKVYYFEDIDIGIIVEKEVGGKLVPTKYFMKKVNEKSFREINDEIRKAQKLKSKTTGYTEEKNRLMEIFISLPKFLRKVVWWEVKRNPILRKKQIGAITVSSIGKYAEQGGWGIVHSFESSHFMIGGIAKKPIVVNDIIEIREILNLTVMVDHYIMDGGPFARFLQKLADLVKSGGCLDGV
jgi:pyruvate/2-oxoglutarate dehydrogenase complex dihydrolipoamide acyltransferase (E2) component